jgi:hypothetical protein
MIKSLALIGATAIALGMTVQSVEAKKVTYEINGKRYSYSTNNRAQVAAARKRIEAAKAAEAAKAERANNPLVSIFGSQVQREAEESKARVEQLAIEKGKLPVLKISPAANSEPSKKDAKEKTHTAAMQPEQVRPKPILVAATMPVAAIALLNAKSPMTPMVKSVYFDAESGIKTIVMTDGSIHEESFDSTVLSRLASDDGGPNSLTAFVNQVRKAYPVETTGSTLIRTAQPF